MKTSTLVHLVITNINASFSPFYLKFNNIFAAGVGRVADFLLIDCLYSPDQVLNDLNYHHNEDRKNHVNWRFYRDLRA